jgi:hypothetical protein
VNVGGIRVDPVLDGHIVSRLHGTKPFPEVGSPLLDDQAGMVHADGLVESTLGGFLVRSGDRIVLVDAGAGRAIPGGYQPPAMDLDDPADPFTVMMAGLRRRSRSLPYRAFRGRFHLVLVRRPDGPGTPGAGPRPHRDVGVRRLHRPGHRRSAGSRPQRRAAA